MSNEMLNMLSLLSVNKLQQLTFPQNITDNIQVKPILSP